MLWWMAGAATLLVVVAALADRRRDKRRNLDQPGWVPWAAIQMIAILIAAVAAALALKA